MSSDTITIMCCLFDGRAVVQKHSKDIYGPEYVNKLYRGFKRHLTDFRFLCITDCTEGRWERAIERVPFELDRRDYFSICEAFRPDLVDGRVLLTGLDTVICGDMGEICSYDGNYGLINNVPIERLTKEWQWFYPRIRFGNGVVMYGPEAADHLWRTFVANPEHWNRTTVMPRHKVGSEMVFMCEQAPTEPDALDMLYPGQIVSFVREVYPNGQGDARLVYFHGESKPHRYPKQPLIQEHWK